MQVQEIWEKVQGTGLRSQELGVEKQPCLDFVMCHVSSRYMLNFSGVG